MPDVAFVARGVSGAEEAEKLERVLTRLDFVNLVNVDPEKGLVAVSFEGGEGEREKIEAAAGEAGYGLEPSPGADPEVD